MKAISKNQISQWPTTSNFESNIAQEKSEA